MSVPAVMNMYGVYSAEPATMLHYSPAYEVTGRNWSLPTYQDALYFDYNNVQPPMVREPTATQYRSTQNPPTFYSSTQNPPTLYPQPLYTLSQQGSVSSPLQDSNIENVYAENCSEKLAEISCLLRRFPVVSLDTEFPGHVCPLPPPSSCRDDRDRLYQHMYNNVTATTPIQIGISLFDSRGNRPHGTNTWQFNMKFDRAIDTQNLDSIAFLEKHGVNFKRLATDGIEPRYFGEFLNASGLVGNKNLVWVNFQGAYDFAYLLKCLYPSCFPTSFEEFKQQISIHFPDFMDIKYWATLENYGKEAGGLKAIAKNLGLSSQAANLGSHQAGADAVLTGLVYFELFKGQSNVEAGTGICNRFHGLEDPTVQLALNKLSMHIKSPNTYPKQEKLRAWFDVEM
jgi:CCR4-NOT transcription complex subunit 7/8